MESKYTEKLAHYIIILITIGIISMVCWYFRDVLSYIVLALLVTVLSAPIFKFLEKIRIKGHRCPSWLAAILALVTVILALSAVMITVVPMIRDISRDISAVSINNMAAAATAPFVDFNSWAIKAFPSAGPDFKIENEVVKQIQEMLNIQHFSTVVGSVTSMLAKLGVTLFAVIFISFFFIKDPKLLINIVSSLVPDRYVEKSKRSVRRIGMLITRYFVGMTIEVLGVSVLNFLGLLLIAKMGFKYSLGIAFMTGILNIIPYLGPLLGGIIGVLISLTIKYACVSTFGLEVSLLTFVLILVGIFVFTQLVDNYVYQPLIYSHSVKVHPLEIFIVFLMAGTMGGMTGMLVAIPAYTVIREIAKQFLSDVKAVRMLTAEENVSKEV